MFEKNVAYLFFYKCIPLCVIVLIALSGCVEKEKVEQIDIESFFRSDTSLWGWKWVTDTIAPGAMPNLFWIKPQNGVKKKLSKYEQGKLKPDFRFTGARDAFNIAALLYEAERIPDTVNRFISATYNKSTNGGCMYSFTVFPHANGVVFQVSHYASTAAFKVRSMAFLRDTLKKLTQTAIPVYFFTANLKQSLHLQLRHKGPTFHQVQTSQEWIPFLKQLSYEQAYDLAALKPNKLVPTDTTYPIVHVKLLFHGLSIRDLLVPYADSTAPDYFTDVFSLHLSLLKDGTKQTITTVNRFNTQPLRKLLFFAEEAAANSFHKSGAVQVYPHSDCGDNFFFSMQKKYLSRVYEHLIGYDIRGGEYISRSELSPNEQAWRPKRLDGSTFDYEVIAVEWFP